MQGSWREYVRALKKVAHTYGVSVEGVSQMMSPAKARASWKKLCLTTHPDKGGNPAHLREITDAKGKKRKWENLLKKEGQAAPSSTDAEAGPQTEQHKEEAPGTELAKPEDIPPPPPELPLAKVDAAAAHCSFCAAASPVFRVQCEALLFPYHGLGGETEVWVAFKPWVWAHRGDWRLLYYCAAWEQCSRRVARAP